MSYIELRFLYLDSTDSQQLNLWNRNSKDILTQTIDAANHHHMVITECDFQGQCDTNKNKNVKGKPKDTRIYELKRRGILK